jgi:hypothetical protein
MHSAAVILWWPFRLSGEMQERFVPFQPGGIKWVPVLKGTAPYALPCLVKLFADRRSPVDIIIHGHAVCVSRIQKRIRFFRWIHSFFKDPAFEKEVRILNYIFTFMIIRILL